MAETEKPETPPAPRSLRLSRQARGSVKGTQLKGGKGRADLGLRSFAPRNGEGGP